MSPALRTSLYKMNWYAWTRNGSHYHLSPGKFSWTAIVSFHLSFDSWLINMSWKISNVYNQKLNHQLHHIVSETIQNRKYGQLLCRNIRLSSWLAQRMVNSKSFPRKQFQILACLHSCSQITLWRWGWFSGYMDPYRIGSVSRYILIFIVLWPWLEKLEELS